MYIRDNMYEVQVIDKDNRYVEHEAWFHRNEVPHFPLKNNKKGIKGWMDHITVTRWEKYFNIPHPQNEITDDDIEKFESYAQFNLDLEKDSSGCYKNDATFQAWQFYKLGRE